MIPGKGKCRNAHEALAAAVENAMDTPLNMELSDVLFGRFTDGDGWYWTLRYTTEMGNTADLLQQGPSRDSYGRRARLLSEQWAADVARVEAADRA